MMCVPKGPALLCTARFMYLRTLVVLVNLQVSSIPICSRHAGPSHRINPCPKNKNSPQTKNRPKNKNRLGLSTERVENKNHLGHKQDKSGEH